LVQPVSAFLDIGLKPVYTLALTTVSGDRSEILEVTGNHPFFVRGKDGEDRGWVEARDLSVGDQVVSHGTADKNGYLLVRALSLQDAPQYVYNLDVANTDTFFVGKLQAWVHNADACSKNGKELQKPEESISDQFRKELMNTPIHGEALAKTKAKLREVAESHGWVKNKKLSKRNNRDVYEDPKTGDLYAADTRHATFEHLDKRGKHKREVDLDLEELPDSRDSSGRHDLFVK
jgi:hypothetical protein